MTCAAYKSEPVAWLGWLFAMSDATSPYLWVLVAVAVALAPFGREKIKLVTDPLRL